MNLMIDDKFSTMPWAEIDTVVFDVGNVLRGAGQVALCIIGLFAAYLVINHMRRLAGRRRAQRRKVIRRRRRYYDWLE